MPTCIVLHRTYMYDISSRIAANYSIFIYASVTLYEFTHVYVLNRDFLSTTLFVSECRVYSMNLLTRLDTSTTPCWTKITQPSSQWRALPSATVGLIPSIWYGGWHKCVFMYAGCVYMYVHTHLGLEIGDGWIDPINMVCRGVYTCMQGV